MKNLKFLVIALVMNVNASAQKNEQIAFNYFFNDIFPAEYKDICKINFNGFTESELSSFEIYKPCFEDEELSMKLNENANKSNQSISILIDIEKVKDIKFIKRKSRYRLSILKASKVRDFFYVQIELTKNNHFTDVYYLKINNKELVTNWCKTGLVW